MGALDKRLSRHILPYASCRLRQSRFGKPVRLETNQKGEHPIKRTSITLEDSVYDAGLEIAAQRGFRQSFSAYVAWLIQRDAEGGVTREELPVLAKKKPVAVPPPTKTPKAKRK